jgi:hypothetical protein
MLWKIDELISMFQHAENRYYFYGNTCRVAAVKPDDILEDFRGTKLRIGKIMALNYNLAKVCVQIMIQNL